MDELIHDRRLKYSLTDDRWAGEATYVVSAAKAAQALFLLQNSKHPASKLPPLAMFQRGAILWYPRGIIGAAFIRAYYDSKWPSTPPGTTGQARLYMSTTNQRERMLVDSSKLQVEGVNTTGTPKPGEEWRKVHGDNFVLRAKCVLRLETAVYYKDFSLATIMALHDAVNNSDLPKFGNAKEGTLRFMGMARPAMIKMTGAQPTDVVEVGFLFAFDPDGWNGSGTPTAMKGLWSQLGTYEPAKVERRVTDGTRIGYRTVLVWQPRTGNGAATDDTVPAKRTIYSEGDFSAFHALATW